MIASNAKHRGVRQTVPSHDDLRYPEAPIIVWRNSVPVSRDRRTMEQKAIDRWENEGGEIPNAQLKQKGFVKGHT